MGIEKNHLGGSRLKAGGRAIRYNFFCCLLFPSLFLRRGARFGRGGSINSKSKKRFPLLSLTQQPPFTHRFCHTEERGILYLYLPLNSPPVLGEPVPINIGRLGCLLSSGVVIKPFLSIPRANPKQKQPVSLQAVCIISLLTTHYCLWILHHQPMLKTSHSGINRQRNILRYITRQLNSSGIITCW